MKEMVYKYGIDFGTTNSSIGLCLIGTDQKEHTYIAEVRDSRPQEVVPSVAFIREDKKHGNKLQISMLEDARSRGKLQGDGVCIKRIKLALEEQGSALTCRVGHRTVKGVEVLAEMFRYLRLRGMRLADELKVDTSGVVLGVPVEYGDVEKNVLKEALFKAGFYKSLEDAEQRTEFVSEPIAVAVHYGLNLSDDKTVLVFDFGGGTLDVAILNLKKQVGKDKLHPHEVLAKERLTLGGEELSRLFFVKCFCSLDKYGTKRIAKALKLNRGISSDELWEKLPTVPGGMDFIEELERCKFALSYAKKYDFSFSGAHSNLETVTFYRDDFEMAIEDALAKIDALLEDALTDAQLDDAYDIDQVILAGGSSLIPAVQTLLVDKFGDRRVSSSPITDGHREGRAVRGNLAKESEALTSIVRGLSMVGCREESRVEDIVDSDYGVMDSKLKEFFPIIKRGTLVSATIVNQVTQEGIYEDFQASDMRATSIRIEVCQRKQGTVTLLGTIRIANPGSKKYSIYMQVNRKKGMLQVIIYDRGHQRWISEIPLNERIFTVNA